MYNLKGFARISAMADNAVNKVAPLGELSTHSMTYSREMGIYTNPHVDDSNNVTIASFLSADDNGMIPMPVAVSEHTLLVTQWIYDQALLGNVGFDPAEFIRALNNEFTDIVGANCGRMIQDNTVWLPEWVSWSWVTDLAEENRLKVWFSDDSFRRQYDEYEFEFIPPVEKLDDLFKTAEDVADLINAVTTTALMEKVEAVRSDKPYTHLRTLTYQWREQGAPQRRLDTDWTIMIYGAAGNNMDAIRDALVDYILSNSDRGREEWIEILPDLFKSTEFVVMPMWHRYSIPNRILEAGIYSPTTRLKDAYEIAHRICVEYPKDHIDDNVAMLSWVYKSLNMVIVGGPENRDEIYSIYDHFRDYISVQTTSIDFNRMSPRTQRWVTLINKMLLIAEEMDDYSDIPIGMTRLRRQGVLYLVASYENIQYMVVSKKHVEDNFEVM